jgi:hypothetical protein
MKNQVIAVSLSGLGGKDQTFHNVIAIKVYKIDHTGPNNQFGGLKTGLLS